MPVQRPVFVGMVPGVIMNAFLYGVLLLQVCLYYLAFPKDSRISKAIVYGVFFLETGQTILSSYYASISISQGSPVSHVRLDLLPMDLIWTVAACVLGGMTACIVQLFYCYRISIISQSRVVATVIALISLGQFAGPLSTVRATMNTEKEFIAAFIRSGCGLLCDVLIVFFVTRKLTHMQQGTGSRATRSTIKNIIILFVEAGTVTVLVAMSFVALFLARGTTADYYFIPALVLSKCYANTMMLIFNGRMHIASGSTETKGAMSSIGFGGPTGGVNTGQPEWVTVVSIPAATPIPPAAMPVRIGNLHLGSA